MSIPKPGWLVGLQDQCIRTGLAASDLQQRLTSSSDLTQSETQALTPYVMKAMRSLALCDAALTEVMTGRGITTRVESMSGDSSSTTAQELEETLF